LEQVNLGHVIFAQFVDWMEWLSESGPSLVAQRIIEKLASAFATKTG
jgi:hypothetical protein